MSSEDPAHRANRSEAVRIPEQLQQAKRSTVPERREAAERPRAPRRASANAGILRQLETERGHD